MKALTAGNTTFLIVDGATSGKFDVIPVKIKSGGSGYEFDASKKTEAAYDVAADKLADSIGRDPTKKADASNSDASTAATAAKTALTPSVTITAFNDASSTVRLCSS
jgi:ribosomal protein S11